METGILHDTNGRMPVLLQDKCYVILKKVGTEISWIPKLHHIHWNGQMVFPCDIHLIFYETPAYGAHHFSLHPWNSFDQVSAPERKPKWVDELHQKQPLLDLDTVILAINSSAAADKVSKDAWVPRNLLCAFPQLLKYASDSWVYIISVKVFSSSRINIRIRCSQILYWPIFLQDNGTRSLSSVEYAEKAALHKHSMWSSLAVDVLLGNLFGLALLYHAESACMWVLKFASDITNELLRSGCVWLMGVPADTGIGSFVAPFQDISSPADKLQSEKGLTGEKASVVVSFLHSNFLTVGQIVMPHYNKILSGKPRTLVATAAYGVLTGRRIPSTIGTDLPIFPWMLISYKEYWRLCHDSILACYRR
ncbi:N-acetylglucosaminyl transferase component family protein / Gpi1 family protein [Prunus dulcis]|uniref:N-acetylglucosaminyl transferase component family protein / Gpi1 family protein n=1 Tax=Prunus dulcis TaxID=3755 RepID=A0A4Y1RF04_PRUDU|nr:N-acetylglucosaminyl transferase component family protein / Gpi1 family protein [Prunus dulcis]